MLEYYAVMYYRVCLGMPLDVAMLTVADLDDDEVIKAARSYDEYMAERETERTLLRREMERDG